jgi:hypothetical protein
MLKKARQFAWIAFLAVLVSFTLSSCKILRGDPRRNCNHPEHGDYMREKQVKGMQKSGL